MNKQINKKESPFVILIFLVVFAVYVVSVFAVGGFADHGGKFWVSFAFALCAFASWGICLYMLKSKSSQPRDWLFGFPVVRHCVIYSIVDIVLSTIFMFADKTSFPTGIAFAIQLIALAVHTVFIVSCFYAKDKIEEVQANVKRKVSYIRQIQGSVEVVMSKVEDKEFKQKLEGLWEDIRYCDPMSNDEIAMLESQIAQVINMMDSSINIGDYDSASAHCDKARQLMKERAIKVRALK